MAPGGVGATAAAHETFIGPPLDDEVRTCHCRILKARRTGSHFTGVLLLCAGVVWCGVGWCGVGQDGAARVVDPIFVHVNSGGRDAPHGFFWKDYLKASW